MKREPRLDYLHDNSPQTDNVFLVDAKLSATSYAHQLRQQNTEAREKQDSRSREGGASRCGRTILMGVRQCGRRARRRTRRALQRKADLRRRGKLEHGINSTEKLRAEPEPASLAWRPITTRRGRRGRDERQGDEAARTCSGSAAFGVLYPSRRPRC